MATIAIYAVPSSGMMILLGAIVAVASYFLGCFNGAVIVSKYILRDDVRNHGSGNAGLTNFHRTFGGALTAVVILCDVLKAVGAMLDGNQLLGHPRRSHRGTHRGSGETGSPHSGPQLALGQMMNQEKYWWELGRQRKWQMYSVGEGGG